MTFTSPFTGPFTPFFPDVIVQEPAIDDDIEIGRPTKRYKGIYVVNVHADTLLGPTRAFPVDNIVVNNTGTSVIGHLPSFSDTTDKELVDSGVVAANVVTNTTGTSVVGNLAEFSDTKDKVLQDSGIATSNVFLADGSVAMTGDLNTDSNGIGRLSSATFTANPVVFGPLGSLLQVFANGGRLHTIDSGNTVKDIATLADIPPPSSTTSKSIYSAIGNGADVTNTVTETTLLTPDGGILGSLTVPANTTQGGTILKFTARSFIGSIDALASVTFKLKVNGSSCLQFTWTSTPGETNLGLVHQMTLGIYGDTNGITSGTTIVGSGFGVAVLPAFGSVGGGPNAWDITVDNVLDWTATWSAASPSNAVQTSTFLMEQLF